MSTNSVSTSRRIVFRSKGGVYDCIFMASCGDLMQEYQGTAAAPTKFSPDFTTDPVTCSLTVTSLTKTGTITPASVEYSVAGVKLTFNSAGQCTTAGMGNIFALSGNDLVIKGNLVGIANGSGFLISVKANMSSTEGGDFVTASLPVSVFKHVAGSSGRLTIAPGSPVTPDPLCDANFTITAKDHYVILKAMLLKDGAFAPVSVKWQKMSTAGVYEDFNGGAKSTEIKVYEKDIDTYANFKAVYTDGSEEITDQQSVLDASDPYGLLTDIWVSEDGTDAAKYRTDNQELTDEMPDAAYLLYEPRIVVRGDTVAAPSLKNIVWGPGALVKANGLELLTITPSSGTYKVTVGQIKQAGVGEYDLVLSATFSKF